MTGTDSIVDSQALFVREILNDASLHMDVMLMNEEEFELFGERPRASPALEPSFVLNGC